MKKTFKLTHPKKKVARVADGVRCDVNKYLKRERRKELPEGADFWDFDCKYGATEEDAKVIHVAELAKYIGVAEEQNLESFYLEIRAKPATRNKGKAPVKSDE